jgi:catechol 2,3-dioxygenase-like lactoylglutathione lyase family enzyme
VRLTLERGPHTTKPAAKRDEEQPEGDYDPQGYESDHWEHRAGQLIVQRRRLAAMLSLDHVQLAAPPGCEPEATRFYGELLGLTELEKPEPLKPRGGVWFAVGSHQLHIGVEQSFAPARKAHPAFSVPPDELDRLAERLAAANAPVSWDEVLPDVRRFFTADPWGNRIEILAASSPPA